MKKLMEIAKAWMNSYQPTILQQLLAEKRLAICEKCPSMVESTVFKYKCNECGCPIGKKIYTDAMGTCPLHKWDIVENVKN
jgi:hypothetical protein